MNMPMLKESNGWASVIGALVGAVLTFVLTGHRDDARDETAQMRENDQAITTLKVEESSRTNENAKLEGQVSSINQTMGAMAAAIQGLKDGSDTQTNAINDLRKRFDDIDSILRPVIRGPGGH